MPLFTVPIPSLTRALGERPPSVDLPNGAGAVRVIAGQFAAARGPARTFTPINVWDLRLTAGASVTLPVPEGHTTALAVLVGALRATDAETIDSAEVALFERDGEVISVSASKDTTALVLSGEPIDEPIVGSGPFVMNSHSEIRQAFADYQSGKMGQLS
jgi:redox-sensitive bicupin YhaK (pirin superfamily)